MKRIAIIIPTMAVAIMINAAPSLSEEGTTMSGQEASPAQRDECLLVALNCPNNVDTIQQRINKLQAEIDRGSAVYSNEELDKLNNNLNKEYELYQELIEGH